MAQLVKSACKKKKKKSACNMGDLSSIPVLGRSPGEGKSYPLQYSGLENSMDSMIHGVTKSSTRQSDFHIHLKSRSVVLSVFFLSHDCFGYLGYFVIPYKF